MPYIVLDLEFNQGFDFTNNRTINTVPSCRFEIIQIGAVKLNDKLDIIDKINIYIKPVLYKKIHPRVQKITNICDKTLKDKPKFKEGFNEFEKFINIDTSPIFCVWGGSDLRALYRNLAFYKMIDKELILKYIDVQKLASKYLKYEKGKSVGLESATRLLEIDISDDFHNALNDALYTAEVLKKIKTDNMKINVFNSKNIKKK